MKSPLFWLIVAGLIGASLAVAAKQEPIKGYLNDRYAELNQQDGPSMAQKCIDRGGQVFVQPAGTATCLIRGEVVEVWRP